MTGDSVIGSIVVHGGPWVWAGAALAALGAVWALAGYRQAGAGRRLLAPLVLRLIGLTLLALSLAEPAWVGDEAEPGANLVAVIADNSQGMQIRDAGKSRSRGEQLADLMTTASGEEAPWLDAVARTFALRRFTMDGRLRRVADFGALDFTGKASSIGGALESVGRRFAGRPVAAVVLLTDGIATDELDPASLGELPPVFPVVMGADSPERDLGITGAAVSQTSFEDAPVTIRADLTARGYEGEKVTVRLDVLGGGEIESREVTPASASDTRSVRFLHRPSEGGVLFYRITVEGEGGKEATAANNTRLVAVNRGDGPYRILYVSGRPNWEYKFLNRSLVDDPELDLVGLIRVARREPKFQWRGREGERNNPLFRGFNPDDDTAEFDQPVLVRMNTRDELELSSGFPSEAKGLFEYHAVVVDDLERSFFTVDQLDLLEAFVSRRGGSLLMLGGAESFAHGGYGRSGIGRMIPVHLGEPSEQPPGQDLRLALTRDGWLTPWMRLRETEPDEQGRLEGMKGFQSLNKVAGIKPGATVMAQVDDGGIRRPALAVQRFGSGRVGALMVADFWRWGFSVPENRPDMEKAWRQVARWLVADVPERVSLELEESGEEAVKATVRVRGEGFEPEPDGRVVVTVTGADGEPVELVASPSDTEGGTFEVTFVPVSMGATRVTAAATDVNGLPVGEAEGGWVANGAADEFQRLEPNRALLESVALATGGEVLAAADLGRFAARLPGMEVPETRTWSRSLWHSPAVFLVVLACFAAEWIIRRRRGMA